MSNLSRSGGAAGGVLPSDGDVIEFAPVRARSEAGSVGDDTGIDQVVAGRHYRVEKKPLELEYLLIDIVSGHAMRVQPQQLGYAKWVRLDPDVSRETPEGRGAEGGVLSAKGGAATPLGVASSASQQQEASSSSLSAKPLSELPFVEDDDEEEVEEEEDDPVTKTKVKVKKKVKKKK